MCFLGVCVCFLVCLGVCLEVESGCLSVFRCVCVCVLSVLFMLFFRFL